MDRERLVVALAERAECHEQVLGRNLFGIFRTVAMLIRSRFLLVD
jgi:hypothetical protein